MINIDSKEYTKEINPLWATYFPYKLDHFQLWALYYIEQNHDILCCANTGSGKTTIATYATLHANNLNKRVIYTTPIKALSNQVYKNLTEKYPDLDIGIHTGDIQINIEAKILIMTTEILRNNFFLNIETGDNLGCVIFDEFHFISDSDRGHVYEQSILSMPKNVQIILLSATIANPLRLTEWIYNVKQTPIIYVSNSSRVVPLTFYIYLHIENNLVEILDNSGRFYEKNLQYAKQKYYFKLQDLNKIIMQLNDKNLLPAFFFCFSRRKCELYAASIITPLIESKQTQENANYFDFLISKYKFLKEDGLQQIYTVRKLIINGVGFHHSGLHPLLKEIIETMFSKNMIKILFVTETFAAGINLPAKTVVFTSLTKFSDNNFRNLHKFEFLQMSGRAGRRGYDTKGTVIIMPFDSDLDSVAPVIKSNISDIKSNFKIDFNYVLKTIENAESYYQKSLQKEDNNSIVENIKREIADLEKYNIINLDLYKDIIEYLQLTGNKKHKFDNSMRRWEKDEIEKFNKRIQHYKHYCENNEKIMKLKYDLDNQQFYDKYEIKYINDFLDKYNYINNDNTLTQKGKYAQLINECNPILLIEIIYSNLLSNLSFEEICAVLSIFLESKFNDEDKEDINIMRYEEKLSGVKNAILNINSLLRKIPELDLLEFDINYTFIYLHYLWANNIEFRELQNISDFYIGDFIKGILKLCNIFEKLTIIYSEYDLEIYSIIKDYRNRLIRSVVTPESLYVSTITTTF